MRAIVVAEVIQVEVAILTVEVEVGDIALTGLAVDPEMYKISSITPPIECQLAPDILSELNLIWDLKSSNTLHQVSSFFKDPRLPAPEVADNGGQVTHHSI